MIVRDIVIAIPPHIPQMNKTNTATEKPDANPAPASTTAPAPWERISARPGLAMSPNLSSTTIVETSPSAFAPLINARS